MEVAIAEEADDLLALVNGEIEGQHEYFSAAYRQFEIKILDLRDHRRARFTIGSSFLYRRSTLAYSCKRIVDLCNIVLLFIDPGYIRTISHKYH